MSNYKLTPEIINVHIKDVKYHNTQDTAVTHCTLILKNGYAVTGESSCIDPTLFDEEIGKKTAFDNAFNKLWGLLAYEVKQRWYEEQVLTPKERVKLELVALDEKRTKLVNFLDTLPSGKKEEYRFVLLQQQLDAMSTYAMVLQERLATWDRE